MVDQPRPKRKGVGSRPVSQRPRRVTAGAPGAARTEEPSAVAPEAPPEPEERPEFTAEREPSAFLASLRTTWGLVAAIVVLALVAAGEIGWLITPADPVVSSSRPVVTGEVTHRAATDAAQRDVVEIFTYSYRDFDARIDKATSLMTPSFAEQFRKTAADVKSDFVANKTQQLVKVRGTSVVRASDSQVQALIFLDQYVTKKGDRSQPGTDYTPFRALVTMVHTEHGWLVDNIDTN